MYKFRNTADIVPFMVHCKHLLLVFVSEIFTTQLFWSYVVYAQSPSILPVILYFLSSVKAWAPVHSYSLPSLVIGLTI